MNITHAHLFHAWTGTLQVVYLNKNRGKNNNHVTSFQEKMCEDKLRSEITMKHLLSEFWFGEI